MSDYADLRSRVSKIITKIANGESNDSVLQAGGSEWYDDERSFQSKIDALPGNLNTLPQYMLVKGNLAEAEQFLYNAGVDAMASCNASSARRELDVADYFVSATRHEMTSGVASSDDANNPPQVSPAANKCSSDGG